MKKLRHATLILFSLIACTLLFAGCNSAFAEEVTIEDTAPAVETGGPDSLDFSAPLSRGDLAMLYYVPSGSESAIQTAPRSSAQPFAVQSATGAGTRLGVDVSALESQAEREGWPWYGKAAVVVGCALVVGLATWGIVEASHKGSHDQDSSTHYTLTADDGATMNVRIGADNNTSSTTTGW